MSFTQTRRGALLGLVAATAIFTALPALADDVTLTFWGAYGNGGNSTQQDALNNTLIPAFEAAHPGVKVKYVDIPYDSLLQKLETVESDPAAVHEMGIEYCAMQCRDLLFNDVEGLHFYTLNKSKATVDVCKRLGIKSVA